MVHRDVSMISQLRLKILILIAGGQLHVDFFKSDVPPMSFHVCILLFIYLVLNFTIFFVCLLNVRYSSMSLKCWFSLCISLSNISFLIKSSLNSYILFLLPKYLLLVFPFCYLLHGISYCMCLFCSLLIYLVSMLFLCYLVCGVLL